MFFCWNPNLITVYNYFGGHWWLLHCCTVGSGFWEALHSCSSTSAPETRFLQTGLDILYPENDKSINSRFDANQHIRFIWQHITMQTSTASDRAEWHGGQVPLVEWSGARRSITSAHSTLVDPSTGADPEVTANPLWKHTIVIKQVRIEKT